MKKFTLLKFTLVLIIGIVSANFRKLNDITAQQQLDIEEEEFDRLQELEDKNEEDEDKKEIIFDDQQSKMDIEKAKIDQLENEQNNEEEKECLSFLETFFKTVHDNIVKVIVERVSAIIDINKYDYSERSGSTSYQTRRGGVRRQLQLKNIFNWKDTIARKIKELEDKKEARRINCEQQVKSIEDARSERLERVKERIKRSETRVQREKNRNERQTARNERTKVRVERANKRSENTSSENDGNKLRFLADNK